jgi:diguanylate cyclase
MRYTESKERCAEVLRATLRHMGQHEARWTPITFTLWFEYAAGINAGLSKAVDECLRNRCALGDDEVERLHGEHIADPDRDAIQKISTELQRVMSSVARNASSTSATAGTFGDQIDRLTGAMKDGDLQALPALLEDATASAQQMKGTTAALVQLIRDERLEIERLRADLTRARDEALLDPLTRVLNRRGLDREIQALVSEPPGAPQVHCLVMIDIDHFKKVNDAHGHVLGDQVIHGLAEVLRCSVPDGDRRIARYGGEEFAILLPWTSVGEGAQLAEAVLRRTRAMRILDRRTQQTLMKVTVSAGVAAMRCGDDASSWIARADDALYKSKQAGRDRVTLA